MSPPLDDALARLGLRPDADARGVRRAYAQQLKQIDQAAQPREFQALREAYEFALAAIARREAAAAAAEEQPAAEAVAEAPAAPPAASGFMPPDAGTLTKAVFETFAARAGAGFADEAQATAALQDALADERLLNLEARTLFELQVAQLIMSGWQPGHEFLFGPACEVFGWEKDRAHLRVFGQLGAALDAAINEKMIFFRLTPREFELQRNVIRRLRQPEMPSVTLRRADLPMVQMLVQRYPNWLRLVTSQANINSWFVDLQAEPVGHGALPPTSSEPSPAAPQPTLQRGWQPAKSLPPWLIAIFVLMMVMRLVSTPSPRTQLSEADLRRLNGTPPVAAHPSGTWAQTPALGRPGDSSTSFGAGANSSQKSSLYGLAPPPMPDATPREGGVNTRSQATSTPSSPSLPVSMADIDSAFQAPALAPTSRPPPPAEESTRIGHVTFVRRDGGVTVSEVAERTRYSHSTLQPGDRLLGCMSSNYHLPLVYPSEARYCVATNVTKPEVDVTPYMFRVLRNGESIPASLTLRVPSGEPASAADPPLKLGTTN